MELIIIFCTVGISGAIWLWFLIRYDRNRPEPLKWVLFVGVGGGLLSAFAAGTMNEWFSAWSGITFYPQSPLQALVLSIFVGINEESCKLLATLLLAWRIKEFDEPIDALIYAMSASLGFAVFENLFYAFQHDWTIVPLRTITAVPGHLAFAAIWGFGIAKIKFIRQKGAYISTILPYLGYSALIHGFYDFVLFLNTWTVFLIFPILIFLVTNAHKHLIYLTGQTPFLRVGECHECRTINPSVARFCQMCGTSLAQEFFRVCNRCNIRVLSKTSNCFRCNTRLAE
ncbi:MAG: PrsW family intramembrane metalloprotease [SAR324 cluster bacterium]|nr:PrsW family intramembrane metalloprotease [SAR324 cluster bacterium]